MENIREWAQQISNDRKTKFSKTLAGELMHRLEAELKTASPDYSACIDVLMSFHYSAVRLFYKKWYPLFVENVQAAIDDAVLKYITTDSARHALPRVAEVLTQRLRYTENAEHLVKELQWYISNIDEKYVNDKSFAEIWHSCNLTSLNRILTLNVNDWPVNKKKIKLFFDSLLADISASETKILYQSFLARNHLNDSAINTPICVPSPGNSPKQKAENPKVEVNTLSESVPMECSAEINESYVFPQTLSTFEKITAPMSTIGETLSANDEECDGIKLLERALAWVRWQSQDTAALKDAIVSSEAQAKRLSSQIDALSQALQAEKEDAAAKAKEISALQNRLADTERLLEASCKKEEDLDKTVEALQRMNNNSASQAVAGYKADLAAALKSLVEDASLPEVQSDANILSALLTDLLDTLRFKGIPLEGSK